VHFTFFGSKEISSFPPSLILVTSQRKSGSQTTGKKIEHWIFYPDFFLPFKGLLHFEIIEFSYGLPSEYSDFCLNSKPETIFTLACI
jgi:hypothetical protein